MASWLDDGRVRAILGADLTESIEDGNLQPACDAARAYVERLRSDLFSTVEPFDFTPGGDVLYGAALLAYRWYARRTSPLGLVELGEGSAGILRHDPDIARLCGIGLAGRFLFGATPRPPADDVVF